jgi:hypothetical protein
MEDNPLFNAGKGAVFTHDGRNELDAAIMDGKTKGAGSVAGVTIIRNPITAARAVMEKVGARDDGRPRRGAVRDEDGARDRRPVVLLDRAPLEGLQQELLKEQGQKPKAEAPFASEKKVRHRRRGGARQERQPRRRHVDRRHDEQEIRTRRRRADHRRRHVRRRTNRARSPGPATASSSSAGPSRTTSPRSCSTAA